MDVSISICVCVYSMFIRVFVFILLGDINNNNAENVIFM